MLLDGILVCSLGVRTSGVVGGTGSKGNCDGRVTLEVFFASLPPFPCVLGLVCVSVGSEGQAYF